MASKGQKFQKWSSNLVEIIKLKLENEHSARELAIKYNISRGTISNWQQKER